MEPIVFSVTMEIHEGKLDAFKESIGKSIAFLKENGPQVMVGIYIDEKNMKARSIQVHRNSASILATWKLADVYIREVMQYITTTRIDIFGQPSEEVMEGMRRFAGTAVLEVIPHYGGFERF